MKELLFPNVTVLHQVFLGLNCEMEPPGGQNESLHSVWKRKTNDPEQKHDRSVERWLFTLLLSSRAVREKKMKCDGLFCPRLRVHLLLFLLLLLWWQDKWWQTQSLSPPSADKFISTFLSNPSISSLSSLNPFLSSSLSRLTSFQQKIFLMVLFSKNWHQTLLRLDFNVMMNYHL